MSLLGSMTSCIQCVAWCQFHTRPLQSWILSKWDKDYHHLNLRLEIPPAVKKFLKMVGGSRSPSKRCELGSLANNPDPDRCQHLRLGSSSSREVRSGSLVPFNDSCILKRKGAESRPKNPESLYQGSKREAPKNLLRQYNYGCIFKETGRNKVKKTSDHFPGNIFLGRRECSFTFSSPSERLRERGSGLPQQDTYSPSRMEPKNRNLPGDCPQMGKPCHRSLCIQDKFKSQEILFPKSKGSSLGSGCLLPALGSGSPLRIPSSSSDQQSSPEISIQSGQADSSCSVLAKEKLVSASTKAGSRLSFHPSQDSRPLASGTSLTPEPRVPESISLDPESAFLNTKGLSFKVIKTLRNSRKPVTHAIYLKIWKKFCAWCKDHPNQDSPNICQVLDFLQEGFDKGLRPSTLKVQVSALSAYFDTALAEHRWVKRFFQACTRLRPTVKESSPQWDLSLVLNALTSDPFEPNESNNLRFLTLKTAFLVAITSARRIGELQALSICEPYLSVSEDRITLRLDRNFLPKVVSNFHRSQADDRKMAIRSPKNATEEKWYLLDVRRSVLRYL
ncbi:uncharacterized protein [Engystomops pustulosus]|uniref:uncharacterized protein isoform X1 n=1 Tax=Engystomops pustulosus TaxID=76066 RepID=UPI003AFB7A0B